MKTAWTAEENWAIFITLLEKVCQVYGDGDWKGWMGCVGLTFVIIYPGFCVEFFFKMEKTALLRYANKEYAVCQFADIFMKAIWNNPQSHFAFSYGKK